MILWSNKAASNHTVIVYIIIKININTVQINLHKLINSHQPQYNEIVIIASYNTSLLHLNVSLIQVYALNPLLFMPFDSLAQTYIILLQFPSIRHKGYYVASFDI